MSMLVIYKPDRNGRPVPHEEWPMTGRASVTNFRYDPGCEVTYRGEKYIVVSVYDIPDIETVFEYRLRHKRHPDRVVWAFSDELDGSLRK